MCGGFPGFQNAGADRAKSYASMGALAGIVEGQCGADANDGNLLYAPFLGCSSLKGPTASCVRREILANAYRSLYVVTRRAMDVHTSSVSHSILQGGELFF